MQAIASRAPASFKSLIAKHSDLVCVLCRFGGESCNMSRDFSHFFDSYYYNCFTYGAPKHRNSFLSLSDVDHIIAIPSTRTSSDDNYDTEDENNLAEGLENGWSTVVLAGSSMLDEYDGPIRTIPGTITST